MGELPRRVPGGYFEAEDGTVWPAPDAVGELEHTLRYGPSNAGAEMRAASVCSAYLHLMTYPLGVEHALAKLRMLRRSWRMLAAEGDYWSNTNEMEAATWKG